MFAKFHYAVTRYYRENPELFCHIDDQNELVVGVERPTKKQNRAIADLLFHAMQQKYPGVVLGSMAQLAEYTQQKSALTISCLQQFIDQAELRNTCYESTKYQCDALFRLSCFALIQLYEPFVLPPLNKQYKQGACYNEKQIKKEADGKHIDALLSCSELKKVTQNLEEEQRNDAGKSNAAEKYRKTFQTACFVAAFITSPLVLTVVGAIVPIVLASLSFGGSLTGWVQNSRREFSETYASAEEMYEEIKVAYTAYKKFEQYSDSINSRRLQNDKDLILKDCVQKIEESETLEQDLLRQESIIIFELAEGIMEYFSNSELNHNEGWIHDFVTKYVTYDLYYCSNEGEPLTTEKNELTHQVA